jgi:hypothetical protein
MAQITPPVKGQPLDIDYLSEIVTSINDINIQLGPTNTAAVSRIAGADPTRTESIRTASVKIYAIQVPVITGKVSVNGIIQRTFGFSSNFLYPPIVTITPIIKAERDQSKNCIATIENVNTAGVDVIFTFTRDAANVSVDAHIIAIGQA